MPGPKKDLSYFLALPYSLEVIPSEKSGFVAHHPSLPGCAAQGRDVAETLGNLSEARETWLQAKWEDNDPIPEPPTAEPSGRLMLRVPINLHASLDGLAAMHGKSLNRLLNEMLFNYVNALPAGNGLGRAVQPAGAATSTVGHYAYRLTPQLGAGFLAEHPDLPGCFSEGADATEAMANLDEARELWIEGRQESGLPIPKPLSAIHTGLIHLRMPPALHADLARDAHRNGATLNQWLGFTLAAGSLGLNDQLRREEAVAAARLREMQQQLRKELTELRITVERPFIDKLKVEHATFLLGLLYLKKKEFEKASILFFSATQGDFVPEEIESVFAYVSKALVDLDLRKAALPVAHSFPQVTEEDKKRRSETLGILLHLGGQASAFSSSNRVLPQMQPR